MDDKIIDIFIPDHVWPCIFKYVNPLKLLLLRALSKNFKTIIEKMFEKDNLWKDVCLNTSIKPWIWNIQEKLLPYAKNYSPEVLDKIWKDVYDSYVYWRQYSERSREVIALDHVTNFVTFDSIKCSDAYDQCFAITNENGVVFIFGIDDEKVFDKSIQLITTFNSNNSVVYRQMKFWNTGKTPLLVLSSPLGNLTLYDVLDEQIHNDLLINAWTRSQSICRGTDNKLLIGSSINMIYQLIWKRGPRDIEIQPISVGNEYEDLWWPIKSFCCQYDKKSIVLKHRLWTRIKFDYENFQQTENFGHRCHTSPDNYYIPIPEVVIINKGTKLVATIVDDSNRVRIKHHSLFPITRSVVTKVVMHVNMLFVGTNKGSIHLFVLKSIKQLVTDDLFKLPNEEILPASDEPILTLDITQINKVPYIIAFTKSKLYVIKL